MAGSDDSAEDPELRESLSRHYLSTADAKIARIDAVLAGLRAASSEAATAEAMELGHLTLHTLAGSAGTYGFPQITTQARALARRLRTEERSPGLLEEIARFREGVKLAFDVARERLP